MTGRRRSFLLALALVIGCSLGLWYVETHAACMVGDEDRRCTGDEDCVYLGTYVERGECCYDPCGGGHAVNRGAIDQLRQAREPLLKKRHWMSFCRDRSETKCSYGRVYCHDGFCKQTHE